MNLYSSSNSDCVPGPQFSLKKELHEPEEGFLTTEETSELFILKFRWSTSEDAGLDLKIVLEPLTVQLNVFEGESHKTYEVCLQLSKQLVSLDGISFRRVNSEYIYLVIPKKNFLSDKKHIFLSLNHFNVFFCCGDDRNTIYSETSVKKEDYNVSTKV